MSRFRVPNYTYNNNDNGEGNAFGSCSLTLCTGGYAIKSNLLVVCSHKSIT